MSGDNQARRCRSRRLSRLKGFCAVRSATSARKIGLPGAQCRLHECQLEEIALSVTAPTLMHHVTHDLKPSHATGIVANGEGDQGLAERHNKGLLGVRWQATARLRVPQLIEDAPCGRSATRRRERHHRVSDIKRPCCGEPLPLPEVSQPRPSRADVDIAELQAPKQRRSIGEFRLRSGPSNLRVVNGERGWRIVGIEEKQGAMPGQMDGKARVDPCGFVRCKKFDPLSSASLHFHDMHDDMHGSGMPRVDLQCASRHFLSAAILTVLLEAESIHCQNAGITGHRRMPFRQDLSNAISQHAP